MFRHLIFHASRDEIRLPALILAGNERITGYMDTLTRMQAFVDVVDEQSTAETHDGIRIVRKSAHLALVDVEPGAHEAGALRDQEMLAGHGVVDVLRDLCDDLSRQV